MKTAKDLKIPFSWEERRPVLLDKFFYIPPCCEYQKNVLPFFDNDLPIIIEYCSGNGQWIGDRAQQNPNFNWIAVEKRFERARKIWLRVHRENIPNLFVVCGEGLVFTRFYAPQAIEAYVNFPDPWPKLRHAKHRLVRQDFLNEVAQIMTPGGQMICATDDSAYLLEMESEFSNCPEWSQVFKGSEWPNYGKSFFKNLWLQKGRTINYLSYEKKHDQVSCQTP